MAPAGRMAKNTPEKAPRVPMKERNDCTAKLFISALALRQAPAAAESAMLCATASFIGSTTKPVTARMAAATSTKVDWKPVTPIRNSTPLPPIAWPTEAPANIRPLARPRSFSSSVLQASESMATSWIAPKVLCTSSTMVNRPRPCGKGTATSDSRVSAIMTCVPRIQARRWPKRCERNTSTKGPKAHLKAQGR